MSQPRHLHAEWGQIKAAQDQYHARREAEQRQRDAQLAVNATPETLRKHRSDVVDRLLERGQIGAEQKRAANEIARVFYALTMGLLPCAASFDGVRGGRGRPDWPPSLQRAYTERYIPWRDEASRSLPRYRLSVADIVFMVAVDNRGQRQVARQIGMDQRTVLNLVRGSLYRYAQIGGWVDDPSTLAIHPGIRTAEFAA
jgi:hypothetical protein